MYVYISMVANNLHHGSCEESRSKRLSGGVMFRTPGDLPYGKKQISSATTADGRNPA